MNILTDEPLRKFEHLDARELRGFAFVPDGRRSERLILAELPPEATEPFDDRVAKAWLRDVRDPKVLVVAPEVEAPHEHGVVQQIDHRAGTERRNELALAKGALGTLLNAPPKSCAPHRRPPSARR